MEDFDKKLSETDAYLQLLIDQNVVFMKKVNTFIFINYIITFFYVQKKIIKSLKWHFSL